MTDAEFLADYFGLCRRKYSFMRDWKDLGTDRYAWSSIRHAEDLIHYWLRDEGQDG